MSFHAATVSVPSCGLEPLSTPGTAASLQRNTAVLYLARLKLRDRQAALLNPRILTPCTSARMQDSNLLTSKSILALIYTGRTS